MRALSGAAWSNLISPHIPHMINQGRATRNEGREGKYLLQIKITIISFGSSTYKITSITLVSRVHHVFKGIAIFISNAEIAIIQTITAPLGKSSSADRTSPLA